MPIEDNLTEQEASQPTWHDVDVKGIDTNLTAFGLCLDLLKTVSGNDQEYINILDERYRLLRKAYNRFDISKLNPEEFPIEIIKQFKSTLEEFGQEMNKLKVFLACNDALATDKQINSGYGLINEMNVLSKRFSKTEGYQKHKKIVNQNYVRRH